MRNDHMRERMPRVNWIGAHGDLGRFFLFGVVGLFVEVICHWRRDRFEDRARNLPILQIYPSDLPRRPKQPNLSSRTHARSDPSKLQDFQVGYSMREHTHPRIRNTSTAQEAEMFERGPTSVKRSVARRIQSGSASAERETARRARSRGPWPTP